MFRKVMLAVAATVVVGSAFLVTVDDASARRGGGFSGGGFSSGGFRGGGSPMRVSRPAFGGQQRFAQRPNGGLRRHTGGGHHRAGSGGHQRHGSSGNTHRRHGSSGNNHHRHGSHGNNHHRHGSHGNHRRHGSHGHHFRHGSWGNHYRFGSSGTHYRRWSWGRGVYTTTPAYVGPTYVAPTGGPTRASGPVCYSCGGWTKEGCYMTYRKFVDENGQPQLRCVEACDAEPPPSAPPQQQ